MDTTTRLGVFDKSSAGQTSLQDIIRKLGRRKILILVMTAVLFLAAGTAIQFLPKTYEGTATVEVQSQTPHAVAVRDVLGDPAFTDE
ncbi:MAG TPA: Wzz/FepE/Etk N-terminal domain-containing protein, partial [Acetobacteraceae bacterium]|nr:Wzz/FepE/Etk N-terminal domain-containing protein [Acetobacteraceae bacterium]